jgi:uncharacterized membrane protein YphA (DoxX/SURF4 family)
MNALSAATLAHVSYVVDPEKIEALSGSDWGFLLSPLTDPFYVTLIIITLVVTVAIFAACELVTPLHKFCMTTRERLLLQSDFIALTLRASLGLALIVAGVNDVIYLPNVAGGGLGGLEVGIGFSLICGLMVRTSAMAALVVFFFGLSESHYLLGTLESAAAALLVMAHGPTRPSADDVLQVDPLGSILQPVWRVIGEATPCVLRIALGTTLVWLAITEKAFNPRLAEAVIIDFELASVIPVTTAMWVFSVGVIEFAVGLVLILGFYTRSFSLIALIVLSLSFFYFKENVAGHVTFFGSLVVLIVTGSGRWSIDSLIDRRLRGL